LATLRDIRRRISSVKSTQQITKAMKMVSAAKLRKAQDRILNARPYALRMNELVSHIAAGKSQNVHPLFEQREIQKVLIVVITSDKGLCGSFNAHIIKRSIDLFDSVCADESTGELITIGRKGEEFFRRRDYPIVERQVNIFQDLDYQIAAALSELIQARFKAGAADRVMVVYNGFKSVGSQQLNTEQLLPVIPKEAETGQTATEYIYEPDAEAILRELVPRNLSTQIWRALLESNAAEHAARMIAMESATENAEEMIYDLTLHYNKARQAAITTEISEIVGGAEALRG
jgi:F-type H+-transporting ATPase subunit gamma